MSWGHNATKPPVYLERISEAPRRIQTLTELLWSPNLRPPVHARVTQRPGRREAETAVGCPVCPTLLPPSPPAARRAPPPCPRRSSRRHVVEAPAGVAQGSTRLSLEALPRRLQLEKRRLREARAAECSVWLGVVRVQLLNPLVISPLDGVCARAACEAEELPQLGSRVAHAAGASRALRFVPAMFYPTATKPECAAKP